MASLCANENFPFPVVEALRHLGHDVLTIREAGNPGVALSDEEVLRFAATERRILLTLDRRHFIRLHHERPEHCGMVVCTVDPDFEALANRIDAALASAPSVEGQLIRVNRPNN